MAENESQNEDKTEDATPERRDEFRERGEVANSREITSVFVLVACVSFISLYTPNFIRRVERLMVTQFEGLSTRRIDQQNVGQFFGDIWIEALWMIVPLFLVTFVIAVAVTFAQTQLNWSWKRVAPDFSRLEPMRGFMRMVNMQALVELLKGIGKMLAIIAVTYLILKSEWVKVPELMVYPLLSTWAYWGDITKQLFWAVSAAMLVIAGFDFAYNFFSLERRMRMTKQEVKEEYKRRETDPHLKSRMRRMAREMINRKVLDKTKDATVLITNPTHFSIALKYELGMSAPIVVAKGVDYLALRMREVAKDQKIPIIENRPLAREIYATVEEGDEIPDKLYKAVAEIIRYVFKLKGRRLSNQKSSATPRADQSAS